MNSKFFTAVILSFCIFIPSLSFAHGNPVDAELYWAVLDDSTAFLLKHLRWPVGTEFTSIVSNAKAGIVRKTAKDDREIRAIELANVTPEEILASSDAGIMKDFKTQFTERYLQLRRKMAAIFNRTIRQTDLEPRYRTPAKSPSMNLFFYAALKAKTNGGPQLLIDYVHNQFTMEHFKDLFIPNRLDVSRTGRFPQPLMFENGMKELENATRFDTPFAFRSFIDTDIVNQERANRLQQALEKTKGFVAVSWTAGKPLNQDYLDALLAMLEERDWIMVVGPTQQIYDGLPEVLLNHPRIHILTHTIENRYLKLDNIPLNPNTEDPTSRVKTNVPGQKVVLFHPNQMMKVKPSTTNEFLPNQVWVTGSLNEPFGPFATPSSGATNQANKAFHKMKFVVFEKGDSISQFDSDGLQNVWHARPVTFANDREQAGIAGFTDFFRSYSINYGVNGERKLAVKTVDPNLIYLGDWHDRVTDPQFVKSLVDDIGLDTYTRVRFRTGDLWDGGSINHWLDGKWMTLNRKYQNGALSVLEEVNQMINSVNALLQRYPNARFEQIVGNHDEWLPRAMENPTDLHKVINGDFLDELGFAVKTLRMNVWDYIFKERQGIMERLLEKYPEKKREILSRVVPVFDPNRIDVLNRDQVSFVGPPWRRNATHFHGDKGSGPKASSFKEQSKAMPEGGGVTGHTHSPKIYGELMDVGVMAHVVQDYTVGTFGAQGQGFSVIYDDGTKQLIMYDRLAGTFRQRDPEKVDSAEKFFGDEKLKVIPNDNDLVPKSEMEDKIQAELNRLKELVGCEADLSS